MKTKLSLWVAVIAFQVIPLHISGQPSFDYASAFVGGERSYTHSLIRAIDDTSALVYYYDEVARQGYIGRLGFALMLRKANLPPNCTVNDMRIIGDNVYFCGHNSHTAVIGHIKLSDFDLPNRTITFYSVDTTFVTQLNRMVAYESAGNQKVVLVGERTYTNSEPFPWDCPYHYTYFDSSINDYYEYYYYNCLSTIILEVNFDGSVYVDNNYVVTGDPVHLEIINEVVESQNWVAFVGYYTNHHTTILHRCDKENVVSSFLTGWHWCYAGFDEGHSPYHGCWMRDDTIAVSSLSTYDESPGNQLFSTNIRVFNLATLENTHAQRVPIYTKSEPYDFMYMPKKYQFVLLQNMKLPLYGEQCAFLHLDPYTTSSPTYYAKSWFDARDEKPFFSLSRPRDTVYIAAGGEYWCFKNFDLQSGGDCTKVDSVKVTILKTEKAAKEWDGYHRAICPISLIDPYISFENKTMQSGCLDLVRSVSSNSRFNNK